MSTPSNDRTARLEGVIEVVILLAVAGMAGAASFTHVHDWTMRFSPDGTGDWFGWANAMVTELIPTAAGLEARRRKHLTGKAGRYPIALIVGAMGLSLTGQFAEATPSVFGWIVAAIPAVGFLALVKLMLSRPAGHTETDQDTTEQPTPANGHAAPTDVSWQTSTDSDPVPVTPAAPAQPATIPAHLLPTARFAVTNHQQTHGRPITAEELSARMSVTPAVAGQLLTFFNPGQTPPPVRVNGQHLDTAPIGGAR